MPIKEPQQDHGIRTVEEYGVGLARDFVIISESNRDSASRLVWFVAISGFALLNMRSFGEALAGDDLSKVQLLAISIPWALTAISGVIAHWLVGELIAKENEFHILKQHAIRSFLANARPKPTVAEILEILKVDDTNEHVAQSKKKVNALYPWVAWAERITFALIVLSLVASLLLPLAF